VNILAVTTFLTIGVINNYINQTLEFLWWGLLIFQGAKLFPYIVLVHWYLKNELHLKEKALLPSALNYDYGSTDYIVITQEQEEEIDREHYASSPRSERI
jgi:hypothetical protein